jgi:hypothetical protein
MKRIENQKNEKLIAVKFFGSPAAPDIKVSINKTCH